MIDFYYSYGRIFLIKLLFAFLIQTHFVGHSSAQIYDIEFELSDMSDAVYYCIDNAEDNSITVISEGHQFHRNDKKLVLYKIDSLGNILSTRDYTNFLGRLNDVKIIRDTARILYDQYDRVEVFSLNSLAGEVAYSESRNMPISDFAINGLEMFPDGEIIGTSYPSIENHGQIEVRKFNIDGSVSWSIFLSDSLLSQTERFIFPGNSSVVISGLTDFGTTLYKLNDQGDLEWNKFIPVDYDYKHYLKLIPATEDILIFGRVNADDRATGISLSNSLGEILWNKDITEKFIEITPKSILTEPDGSFYIAGNSSRNDSAALRLMKFDLNGNILIDKIWPSDSAFSDVCLMKDEQGNFVITGSSLFFNETPISQSPFIVKLDPNARRLWSWSNSHVKRYDHVNAMTTSRGDYVLYGRAHSTVQDEFFVKILKFDQFGRIVSSDDEIKTIDKMTVFPVPSDSKVTFRFNDVHWKGTRIRVVNSRGELYLEKRIESDRETVKIASPGVYSYSVINSRKTLSSGKIVIQ